MLAWDDVGEDEGTGIVHVAPGAGAEDFALGKEHDLPAIAPLDESGQYIEGFGPLSGRSVADVNADIFDSLKEKGVFYKLEDYTHRYPVCWRCDTELVFRLVDEWFISMDELRGPLMDVTNKIHWEPGFGRERELGLAPQHARLDDLQEALLGPCAAHLQVRRLRERGRYRQRNGVGGTGHRGLGGIRKATPPIAHGWTRSRSPARNATSP